MPDPRPVALLALLLAAACEDLTDPDAVPPIVTIRGVVTAAPDDSVFLTGVAVDPFEGTLPDSALHWSVNEEPAGTGATVGIRMPVTGVVTVELRARGHRGEAVAAHEISVAEPGRLLWLATLPPRSWWNLAAAGGDVLVLSDSVVRIGRGLTLVGTYAGRLVGAVPGSRDVYLLSAGVLSEVHPKSWTG